MSKYEKIITAHRGASGLVKVENTLESFEKAIELDVDSIECDVRLTKDNVIIINHNPDIFNMLIKDYTYEELNNKTKENGYHLPTLIEALNYVKGRMIIDIEIKEVGYEDKILKEILSVLKEDEFFIRSFFDSAILKIKELDPKVRTVLLLGLEHPKHVIKTRFSEVFPKRRAKACKCDYISPYYQLLLLWYTARVRKIGLKTLVWTVNDKALMDKILYKKKAEGIVTNYPNLAIELVNEKKNK